MIRKEANFANNLNPVVVAACLVVVLIAVIGFAFVVTAR
jgi:hypothetical protein